VLSEASYRGAVPETMNTGLKLQIASLGKGKSLKNSHSGDNRGDSHGLKCIVRSQNQQIASLGKGKSLKNSHSGDNRGDSHGLKCIVRSQNQQIASLERIVD